MNEKVNKKENVSGEVIPEITVQFHKSKVYGKVTSSTEVYNLLKSLFSDGSIEVQEYAFALFLNRSNEVIGYYKHSVGATSYTVMEPKLILAAAMKCLSSSIILGHNHPSGNLKASQQDIDITKRINEAAKLVDIDLLDHMILTKDGYTSLADQGLCGPYETVEAEPSFVSETKQKTKGIEEARNLAKYALQKFVHRGETMRFLKTLNRSFHYEKYKGVFNEGKIVITHADSKASYEFPLQSIYNEVLDEMDDPNRMEDEPQTNTTVVKRTVKPKREPVRVNTKEAKEVEKIEEEVKFIKRYVLLHDKDKTDLQLLNVLSALQKAILEKRIRKTSKFKKEVEFIQSDLVARVNKLSKIANPSKRFETVRIIPAMLKKLAEIAGSEKVRLSINYLKRYIGIQGKNLTKEKATRLMELLQNAAKSKKITRNDPYAKKIETIYNSLSMFVDKAKRNETLKVHEEVLNGINDYLGCGCDEKKKTIPLR